MKRILVFMIAALMVVPVFSQDKKAERRARREARRVEQQIRDSLRRAGNLDEEINVGYGTTKRRNTTSAVSKVNVDEKQLGSYSDIGQYLRGRVPGLVVTKSGDGYKYTIRGVSTINGSSDPLFVVDGAVVSDISYLNPRDVKSAEVLRDGSAAAIYGTRGANGVILITTKKGTDY